LFTLADSTFAFACNTYGYVTLAASAKIEFLRPAKLGDALTARASEAYRGRKTGIYDVRVLDQNQRLIALFRGRSAQLEERLLDQD
jgi:acyl-CoA thioesterase